LQWFFDDIDNKVGRSWYTTELRVKSNEDLWRLWYVLLREKNMLNTIRFQCRVAKRLMPNYGRIKKVTLSMSRLKRVWDERALLKLRNRQQEIDIRKEQYRNSTIEWRRKQRLQIREQIKFLYHQYMKDKESNKIDKKKNKSDKKKNKIAGKKKVKLLV